MKHVSKTRFLLPLFLCAAMLSCAYSLAAESAEHPPLLYFFENYCDSCHPETEFADEFSTLTGRSVGEYSYRYYNVRYENNRRLFEAMAKEYGISSADLFLPMVVVDGTAYVGNSGIESALPMDFIQNESTDSRMYYLYSPACESCAAAEKIIDALPDTLIVKRGKAEFESKVVVERINIYEDPSRAQALFHRYRVPEDKQTTPVVFLREEYIRGADLNEGRLSRMLSAGLAVGTPEIAASGENGGAGTLSVAGAAAAGFVAGFNPCALSMLLLFLSIMLSMDERAARYAIVYLAVKYITSVAIGTAFLSLLSAWNPTWLPMAARILLTAVGGGLIALNIMDAWAAHHEKYGQIKNQLPARLRGFLTRRIRGGLHGSGAILFLSVALLGVIVAASEFLCSGQLYLANMIAGFSAGETYARQIALLLLFCAAFLLPSAVIAVIAMRQRNTFSISNTILRHMTLIKLATAAAMLIMIVAAWIISILR